MGAQSSIQKSIVGQGKLQFKLDWLHPLGRGLSSADCLCISAWSTPLPALLGSMSFSQRDIFQGGEQLDILLEKGINVSNYTVDFRTPTDGRDSQQSITIKNTLTPATSIHGIANNSFGSVYGGVRMHRLFIEMDKKWSPNPKWTSTAGIRIETSLLQGAIFADYGTDMGSGRKVNGDPARHRGKRGSGFGYGVGIRMDSSCGPLRIDYAVNESKGVSIHIGLGYHE